MIDLDAEAASDDYGVQTTALPPPGAGSDTALLEWVNSGIYYTHLHRMRDVGTYRRHELLDQGQQWLWRASAGYGQDNSGVGQWKEINWQKNDPKRMPTPVLNDGFLKRLNESARLLRPRFRPTVRPRGADPRLKEKLGAKRAQDFLRHRLDEMGWEAQEDLLAYHMPLYGGAWLLSCWDEPYTETVLRPLTEAVRCEACGFSLAENSLRADTEMPKLARLVGGPIAQNAVTQAEDAATSSLNVCPICPDGRPLGAFSPDPEGSDSLGRPLGRYYPRGKWVLKVVSPYDVFPLNMGYDQAPGSVNDITYVHAERLDWIHARWPTRAANIQPENPAALQAFHPVGGAPDLVESALMGKTFRDMARVKERVRAPIFTKIKTPDGGWGWGMDRGRHVVVVNQRVLYDGDLLAPSVNHPGRFVPRMMFDYAPWELLDGGRRIQGFAMWRLLDDASLIQNEIVSQTQAVRRHGALPMYAMSRAHNPEVGALDIGMPTNFVMIDVDPDAPNFIPQLFNNVTIPEGVHTELQAVRSYLDRAGGSVTEQGSTQPGVDAAAAIRQLKEASGEVREPRVRREKGVLRRVFRHGADLSQHLIPPDDAREIRFEDDEGRERWEAFNGLQLGTSVEVDVEPAEPDREKQRLDVAALIQHQVLAPQASPALQRKIAKFLAPDAPVDEIFEDEQLQETAAKREWEEFRDKGRVPVMDPSLDDAVAHVQEHGRDAHSEWFRQHEDDGGWDAALRILADTWEQDLFGVLMTPIPDRPTCLDDRIRIMWTNKLMQAGFRPENDDSLRIVLAWRAHIEAHRLEGQRKMLQATQQPVMAAPGGATTAVGTQPTATEPPRGMGGGPGVGGAGRDAQAKQQAEARALAQSYRAGVPASVMTEPLGG